MKLTMRNHCKDLDIHDRSGLNVQAGNWYPISDVGFALGITISTTDTGETGRNFLAVVVQLNPGLSRRRE